MTSRETCVLTRHCERLGDTGCSSRVTIDKSFSSGTFSSKESGMVCFLSVQLWHGSLARTHPCCYLLSTSCMQTHPSFLPPPSQQGHSILPLGGQWLGGAGDLPTEEEVGAGPAADATVMSEPAAGGSQPGLLVPRVPVGLGEGGLNPFPASLSQTAIPQLAWPTRFPDFTTGAGADSRTVSSGRETPRCLASHLGTSRPPSLSSSQT